MTKTNVQSTPSNSQRHDTPFFRTARCEYEQGLGQARPNKITWKTRRSLRSEVLDGQEIFKN